MNMKRIIPILILSMVATFNSFGQVLNQVKRSEVVNAMPVATEQTIIGSDTTYMQKYSFLEIRNDSFCIVNGDCLLSIPQLDTTYIYNAIDANCVGLVYDKGSPIGIGSECDTIFLDKKEYGGLSNVYNIGNFEYDGDTILSSVFIELGEGLVFLLGDGKESSPFEFALDLTLNDSETIDFTQQQTAIFTAEVDTSIIATQNYVGSNGDNLGDHIATENIQMNDNYLSNDGGDEGIRINDSGNVGINTTNPTARFFVNGEMDTDFPEDSGLRNVSWGDGNLTAQTTGTEVFAFGSNNGYTGVNNLRSFLVGTENLPVASQFSYSFAVGWKNNKFNTSGSFYNFFLGLQNAEDAQGLEYSFFSGALNAQQATAASYTTLLGRGHFQNTVNNIPYNFASGREHFINATDVDYSFVTGFRNGYGGSGANLDYAAIIGYQNLYNASSTVSSVTSIGYQNLYASTGNLNYNISIGRENGKLTTTALNNSIYLGYRQGYSIGVDEAAPYRLAIGMYQNNPLIYGEFDNAIVKINGDFEGTGKVTVGDNVEGNAVNIAGYDSENDLTRVSIGTGLSLTTGTLNATATTSAARVQTFNYTLSSADILYDNLSFLALTWETGDVDADVSLNRITADVTGYYRVTLNGQVFNNAGTQNSVYVRLKKNATSMAEYEALVSMGVDEYYPINFTDVILLTAGQYITLEARRGVSTKSVYIDEMYLTMEKI